MTRKGRSSASGVCAKDLENGVRWNRVRKHVCRLGTVGNLEMWPRFYESVAWYLKRQRFHSCNWAVNSLSYLHLSFSTEVVEYETMSKDVNRSAYTRRILEIVGNIKKQKEEINKVGGYPVQSELDCFWFSPWFIVKMLPLLILLFSFHAVDSYRHQRCSKGN